MSEINGSRINIPLMRKVLEHIEAHPEQHDQRTWGYRHECGTTACMAGWSILLSDEKPVWVNIRELAGCETPNGHRSSVLNAAVRLLGLSHDQAYEMFIECRTLADLWEKAEEFTDGELKRIMP